MDCEGHWSACTAACETVGQWLWVQTQSPSSFGQLAFRGLHSAGGGGFYGGSYSVTVASDATSPSGGAIAVGSVGTLTATNVEFSDNALVRTHSGSSHGGAVYVVVGGIAHFTRAAFTNNLAGVAPLTTADEGGSGGAIYVGYGSSLTLDDCQLTGNATELGGGIYQNFKQGSQLSITGTTFSGNHVTDTGSAPAAGPGSQGVHRCDTYYGQCPTSNPKLSDSAAVSAQPILIERP
eukprot:COSAG02_NODE_2865_length_7868_cov_42.736002_6_plen_236_part_00